MISHLRSRGRHSLPARKFTPFNRAWDVNNIVAGLLFVDAIALLINGMRLVYFNTPVQEFISAKSHDKPAIRFQGITYGEPFGVHWFGDFLQPLDWAHLANPWTADPSYLVQYPPLPIYALSPLGLLPYPWALTLYLSGMALSSFVAVLVLTGGLRLSTRILLGLTLGIVATPFLMAFDRGNLVGYFGFLFAIFMYAIARNHKKLAIVALVCLVCLKIYPILLLLVFIQKRWFRPAIVVVVSSLVLTLSLFWLTPGNFLFTLHEFFRANFGAANLQDKYMVLDYKNFVVAVTQLPPVSAKRWAKAILLGINGLRYLVLFGIALTVVLRLKRLHTLEVILLSGFAMMLIYGAQIGYNWTWAPAFAVAAITAIVSTRGETFSPWQILKCYPVLVAAIIGFTLMSLPLALHLPGSTRSLTPYIGLATAAVCVVLLLVKRTRTEISADWLRAVKAGPQTVQAARE